MSALPAIVALVLVAATPLAARAQSADQAQPAPTQTVTAAVAPATPTSPKADVICRRTKTTGSLVQRRTSCHTRGQWAQIDELQNRSARQMVLDGTGRPDGLAPEGG